MIPRLGDDIIYTILFYAMARILNILMPGCITLQYPMIPEDGYRLGSRYRDMAMDDNRHGMIHTFYMLSIQGKL
jgi:hypothetical protein